MIRRLNYTQRKSITNQHVVISLHGGEEEVAEFNVEMDLRSYKLPDDGRVFIEATRQTSFMRWDCGVVADIRIPADRQLTEFPTGEAATFRVKVVAASGQGELPPRILASASRITPRRPSAPKHRRSLLSVDWGDDESFRHQPWRLEIDEEGGPLLRVSRYLVEPTQRDEFVTSGEFVSLALPAVFQAILTQILLVDELPDESPGDTWRSLWLAFAGRLAGPPPTDENTDYEAWIESAVAMFCRRFGVRSRFTRWREGTE